MEQAPDGTAAAILLALRFAAEKHKQQRRKDADATPYVNHVIAVADTLAGIGGVADVVTLQAAILHDTLEDTKTSAQELDQVAGAEVRSVVQEVTDDKSLPSPERKRLQVEHAPRLSARAKQIKIADKLCNLGDIMTAAPVVWGVQRKLEYLHWAEQVVAGCRGLNRALEQRFDLVSRQARQMLEAQAQQEAV